MLVKDDFSLNCLERGFRLVQVWQPQHGFSRKATFLLGWCFRIVRAPPNRESMMAKSS
jgi:hypothetical protein